MKKKAYVHSQKMAKYYKEDNIIGISTIGLEPELLTYLSLLKTQGERSDWIRKALAFRFEYDRYPKGFLIRMIQEHYTLCKHLIRQIGAAFKVGKIN